MDEMGKNAYAQMGRVWEWDISLRDRKTKQKGMV